ncbi:MAG: hypothetical protein IKY22_00295 [Bacteroidales bacterium]|nr:hypothetical protein [Bacteroidales bacterium]
MNNNSKEIVSNFRKGIAIARSKHGYGCSEYYEYCLVDANGKTIYNPNGMLTLWSSLHRFLNGYYYFVQMERYRYMTFPGKDINKLCLLRPVVKYILNENGQEINKDEYLDKMKEDEGKYVLDLGENISLYTNTLFDITNHDEYIFNPLQYINILRNREFPYEDYDDPSWENYNFLKYKGYKGVERYVNENGHILCGNTFFDTENQKKIFSIRKKIEPLTKFKDGRCKVGVVSDYRNYIVIVSETKIKYVFEEEYFILISKLLDIDLNKLKKTHSKPMCEPYRNTIPKDVNIKFIKPDIEVEILNYSLKISIPYELSESIVRIYDEKYEYEKWKSMGMDNYYFVDNEWQKIRKSDIQLAYDKIFYQKCNRPNFIKEIENIISDIPLNGKEYSIFKFQCRPYGYITKDGTFDYDFDVNNIKW